MFFIPKGANPPRKLITALLYTLGFKLDSSNEIFISFLSYYILLFSLTIIGKYPRSTNIITQLIYVALKKIPCIINLQLWYAFSFIFSTNSCKTCPPFLAKGKSLYHISRLKSKVFLSHTTGILLFDLIMFLSLYIIHMQVNTLCLSFMVRLGRYFLGRKSKNIITLVKFLVYKTNFLI